MNKHIKLQLPKNPVLEYPSPFPAPLFITSIVAAFKNEVIMICIECTAMPNEVKQFYNKNKLNIVVNIDDTLLVNNKDSWYVFPLNDTVAKGLIRISNIYHYSEYCDNLFVINNQEVLIDASGFCHENFHVNLSVEKDKIEVINNILMTKPVELDDLY